MLPIARGHRLMLCRVLNVGLEQRVDAFTHRSFIVACQNSDRLSSPE